MRQRTDSEQPLVLVVEDEPIQATVLEHALGEAGFRVHLLDSGAQVVDWVSTHRPDAVLLDLVLPDADGFELCDQIRAFSTVPLIMTTARVEEVDRLRGLDLGADDYVCKPVSPQEVTARLRALLRRAVQWREADPVPGLAIDEEGLDASWNGTALKLTVVEFRLLATIARRPGTVFSREQLLDAMYEDHRDVSDRTVDSHVKNLRRKFAQAGVETELVESVYGAGYRFCR
ncbi:MAG: response regulator [Pseudomonadota bacterium]